MFGEVAVFENNPYPISVQAMAETKVVGIKRDKFLSFLANGLKVTLRIISTLAPMWTGTSHSSRFWFNQTRNLSSLCAFLHYLPRSMTPDMKEKSILILMVVIMTKIASNHFHTLRVNQ